MTQTPDIYSYYNHLAPNYDENRFGNTYGQYLHQQETQFLKKIIQPGRNILDIGCGTGRHLHFATHGLDLSENMIEESGKKFPDKILKVGSAFDTGFESESFGQVFSFHVLMHLSKEEIKKTILEAYRILEPGGQFIFDIPSYKRRKLINYTANNWHGAASLSIREINELTTNKWNLKKSKGILFMPIHRFPTGFRKMMLPLDNLICTTFVKEYASYLMIVLEKK